jgi:glycine/D-amino acid oxidase-like deaminating enzyme
MIREAECVVVGGGVLGCAAAYELARAGLRDILLVEQADIAGGTTNQGAGLVGQVRSSVEKTRLLMRSRQIIVELQEQGLDADWHPVGSLRVSLNAARDAELEELARVAREAGLEAQFISVAEAQRLFPGLELTATGARRVLWCPSDGYVSAPGLAHAYAEAGRRRGVRFATGTAVLGFEFDGRGGVAGLITSAGAIRCRTVVVAVGAVAARLGERAGLKLPIFPVRHQSLVTTPLPGFHPELPVVRIPDARIYLRPYGQAALIGAFTESALAHEVGAVGGPYPQAKPDAAELELMLREATPFLPQLAGARIAQERRGLPTCAPDGMTVLGPVPGIPGLHLLAACHAHGVAASGGLGLLLTECVLHGRLPPEARAYDPARWVAQAWDTNNARQAAERILQTYYALIDETKSQEKPCQTCRVQPPSV